MKPIRDSKGFTLIELLVVVAIIGILAAIAIPQFAEYRKRGFNARAESDLRNAATAEESLVADGQSYVTCSAPCATLPGFNASAGVALAMTGATTVSFTGTAKHPSGCTTGSYSWDSTLGGLQAGTVTCP